MLAGGCGVIKVYGAASYFFNYRGLNIFQAFPQNIRFSSGKSRDIRKNRQKLGVFPQLFVCFAIFVLFRGSMRHKKLISHPRFLSTNIGYSRSIALYEAVKI